MPVRRAAAFSGSNCRTEDRRSNVPWRRARRMTRLGAMKKWRDTFIDGLLLAVPLIVLGVILARSVRAIAKISAPISTWLPDIRWLGVTLIDLVAVVILVLVLTL